MKVIIAGSRHCESFLTVFQAIDESGFSEISEVVSGACPGVDLIGEYWAKQNKIKITQFPAEWDKYGKAAGPIRNEQMAIYADALIAVWDGKSRGTKSMISLAKKYKLRVYVKMI